MMEFREVASSRWLIPILLLGLLAHGGCGTKEKGARDQNKPAKTNAPAKLTAPLKSMRPSPTVKPRPRSPKLVTREIERLGVKVVLPDTSRLSYPTGRRGHVRVRVGRCVAILEEVSSTFEQEIGLATKGKAQLERRKGRMVTYFAPKVARWIKKKKLGDGFELEYESVPSGHAGTQQVVVRRRVGMRSLRCTTDFLSRDAICVRTVCYGLRPLK